MSPNIEKLEITIQKNNLAHSALLQDLNREIEKHLNITTEKIHKPAPSNSQGVDPIMSIGIANIAISSFTLIWSIISNKYRGKVVIERTLADGSKVSITSDRLTNSELHELVKEIEMESKEKSVQKLILRLDEE